MYVNDVYTLQLDWTSVNISCPKLVTRSEMDKEIRLVKNIKLKRVEVPTHSDDEMIFKSWSYMTQLVMSPAADDNVRMLDVSDTQYCLNINMFSAWVVQVQWREYETCCLKAIALNILCIQDFIHGLHYFIHCFSCGWLGRFLVQFSAWAELICSIIKCEEIIESLLLCKHNKQIILDLVIFYFDTTESKHNLWNCIDSVDTLLWGTV